MYKYIDLESGDIIEAVEFNAVDSEEQLTRSYPRWFIRLLIQRVQYHMSRREYWLFSREGFHPKHQLNDGTFVVNLGSPENDELVTAMEPDYFNARFQKVEK